MSIFTSKERVAVLRGGAATTSRLSLASGAAVIDALKHTSRFVPVDVVVAANGEWLHEGRVVQPEAFLPHIDQAYIAVLGTFGEDGSLARLLDRYGITHQTESPYVALQTWQKHLATERLQRARVRVPRRVVAYAHSTADWHTLAGKVSELFGPQFVVKPLSGTQHQAVRFVARAEQLPQAVAAVLSEHPACLIEEWVSGQPLTVTSAPQLRNSALYHTPSLQYQHQLDANGHLAPESVLVPPILTKDQKAALYDTLDTVYKTLELKGAARTDVVITNTGEVCVVEINTISPLHAGSAVRENLASVGIGLDEFLAAQLAH